MAAVLLVLGAGFGFSQGTPVQVTAPDKQRPNGAMVGEVTADGPAAKAGIAPRDVITAVEGQSVRTLNQIAEAILRHKPGDTMKLTIARASDGATAEVTMTLGANPKNASVAYMGLTLVGVMWVIPEWERAPSQPQSPGGI